MDRYIFSSKQEFLDSIRKASAIILYADTSLPIWRKVLCSVGEINMQILSYNKYEVIEILSGTAERFRMFWSKMPEIKYYFIQKLNENDTYGAVIPAKSNETIEKWLEAEIK